MITLKIPEMSCNHCIRAIDGAVRTVDPTATIQADLGALVVKVDTHADEAALRRAIADAGYDSHRLPAYGS